MKKTVLITGVMMLAAGAAIDAQADPRDDALGVMRSCAAVPDRAARLACYDAAIASAPRAQAGYQPAYQPAPPVGSPVAPAGPAYQPAYQPPIYVPPPPRPARKGFLERLVGDSRKRDSQRDEGDFGSESIGTGMAYPKGIVGDTVDRVKSAIEHYQFDNGVLTVTLDNGQIWQQVPGDTPVGRMPKVALAVPVVVDRQGSAAGYGLHLPGVARVVVVRRTR